MKRAHYNVRSLVNVASDDRRIIETKVRAKSPEDAVSQVVAEFRRKYQTVLESRASLVSK